MGASGKPDRAGGLRPEPQASQPEALIPCAVPTRVQLRRTKGWRMPPNTVKVDRTSRWGNPFRIGDIVHRGLAFSGRDEIVRDAAHAVQMFERWLFTLERSAGLVSELRGKNLACWCLLDAPCHADALLEMANEHPAQVDTLPIGTKGSAALDSECAPEDRS